MEITKQDCHGYERLDFLFEDRECTLVVPKEPAPGGKWLYKTEYFKAFPNFELEMLSRGWYVAHMKNITRWVDPSDTEARPRFCDFLHENFGLSKKCLPVGMSCGGMEAVYFAAKYPEYISAMYLDAPVMNLMSCPFGLGRSKGQETTAKLVAEFTSVTGRTIEDVIVSLDHPMHHIDKLLAAKIPVFLVCGDSDMTVPYLENGKILADAYRASDVPFFEIIKEGCDHHPHCLEDVTPLVEFAEKFG